MGFEEAVTEIWSVDSQYSQNNGVMVMVTGSLQCKVTPFTTPTCHHAKEQSLNKGRVGNLPEAGG